MASSNPSLSDRDPLRHLGFGSTASPFGGATTGTSGAFGGGASNTSTGFGSGSGTGGGFGTNTTAQQPNALFGSQPRPGGFGTTNTSNTGSLFGGGTQTAGTTGGFGTGGGFGSTGTTGGFGANASAAPTGGSLFGGAKPTGFGTSATGTGGFGTSGGFGSTAATTTPSTGFGGSGTAFQGALPNCEGTGSTPFSPWNEKDTASANTTNHYQSICFMQPYNKWSFEELRLADYQQGRRFGNGSGQAGGFGAPAFGNATTGGFGQQNTTATPSAFGTNTTPFGGAATTAQTGFGTTQTAGSGFGSTGANPLFGGAAKPATSLFGGGTPAASSGSLFGGATQTAGGFGSNTGTGTTSAFGNTGGSMFGANNQQQQNKPAFGAAGTTGGSAFGGFGNTQTTTAANPFGASTATASPFGGGAQQPATSAFGGFGGAAQQNQTQTQPKSMFGGGFGAGTQQQGTGTGLLGGAAGTTPAAGSSLFGGAQQQPQQTGSSLFGGTQQQPQQTGTSLFGGQNQQQQKPGGLFGSTPAPAAGGFSGFGASQPQPAAAGSSLFNTQNQQQQKPGGLFSSTTGTTGSLFGGGQTTTGQGAGSSLFGGQSQQPQAGGLGVSSFGASIPGQQSQPAPGSFQASLLDGNPYGSQSIFSGLPAPGGSAPGPLATPLSSSMKQKQRTPLPVYRITPSAANRLITPPKRGYGFSYSTYGSPSGNTGTPSGLGSSLLAAGGGSNSLRGSVSGSIGRTFSKSYSTSNLRKTFDPEADSILSPGALQAGSVRGSSNLKRLTINRGLRNEILSTSARTSPAPLLTNGEDAAQSADKLKKKVSFDAHTSGLNGGDLVRVEPNSPEPSAEELGFLRSVRKSGSLNGFDAAGTSDRPEAESARRDLAVVPESAPQTTNGATVKRLTFIPGGDPRPGEYWMQPSRAELSRLSRDQLRQVVDFTVGRQNCGSVTFNGPVDLTTVDLDNLYSNIVDIGLRKITVYPDESVKPARGKGLNVPSTLRIENSWPRGRDRKSNSPVTSGPLFDKHIDRLQKVGDTEFVNYETETGTWVFKVPHFTTYGLDYDEEEGESLDQSTMSAQGPDHPTPRAHHFDQSTSFDQSTTFSIDESFVGSMIGVEDDTFDFKKRKLVPGSFASRAMPVEDDYFSEGETESFLEEGSTGSTTENDDDVVTESQQSGDSVVGSDEADEMDMAGAFPTPHRTVERDDYQSTNGDLDTTYPISKHFGSPAKPQLDLSGDWAEQLQRTISPRKQNRDALREMQANAFIDRHLANDESPTTIATAPAKKGFSNSIDLMNSLFQQPRKQAAPSPLKASKAPPKGFEWPYNKQPKTFAGDTTQMSESDAAFHDSFKPRWGPMDSLVCAKNDVEDTLLGVNQTWKESFSVFSEERDIAVMTYNRSGEVKEMLDVQRLQSSIQRIDGTPFVRMAKVDLSQFPLSPSTRSPSEEERLVWQLLNILFNDDIEDDISAGVPPRLRQQFAHRIKKDRLTRLWEGIIREKHSQNLDLIRSPVERAVHLICSHRVEEACKTLIDSQNPHLATIVAQIGRDATSRADIANQIDVWRQNNVLSEISEPTRALYELVAGNALRSEGKSGGALEDRASSFGFTERFDLDWFQAFGLRLWYCTAEDEPIEVAVAKFLEDLATGQEPAFPHPSHQAGSRAVLQPSSDTLGRESPLWVLLKAFSVVQGQGTQSIQFPASFLPESVSGDRLSNRLSFQLHHVLAATVGQNQAIKIDQHQTDQLIWDFASELSAGGKLDQALFVLLHLSQANDRKRAVQETLARFAAQLPEPFAADGSSHPAWQYLITELQLPEAWIWVAKALHARDIGDAAREVDCLIRGKHWNDAHATFCRIVGPSTIIEGDYRTLEALVSGFGDGPERKMRGWSSGGGVYEDFLRLVNSTSGRRDPTRLNRLVNALVAMGDRVQGSSLEGLEERVAFKEMSRAVAGWITHEDVHTVESSAVLGLPLTGDARVLQTAEMSRRYYGVIMAGGY
ncbi:Peptidase S59, nucleoporin [Penicillium italicum]|uniref:Peptidase S59, nucleoporin n=1 Tax=Penicillium italicum TaxID=40296 RepID=A0A0A2LGU6_PENIT|nr:Peptidase S59, nucleoporin [Penicillium italicum]